MIVYTRGRIIRHRLCFSIWRDFVGVLYCFEYRFDFSIGMGVVSDYRIAMFSHELNDRVLTEVLVVSKCLFES